MPALPHSSSPRRVTKGRVQEDSEQGAGGQVNPNQKRQGLRSLEP